VFLPFSKVGLGRRGTFSSWVRVAGYVHTFSWFTCHMGPSTLFDYHVFHAMNHDIITIINHMISILLT